MNPAARGGAGISASGGQASERSSFQKAVFSACYAMNLPVPRVEISNFAEAHASTNPRLKNEFDPTDLEAAKQLFERTYRSQPRIQLSRNPDNLFGQFLREARVQGFTSEEDRISFAKWYTSQEHILHIAENPSPHDVQEMLFIFRQEIAKLDSRPELLMSGWELYNKLCGSVNASIPFEAHQGASKRISKALGGKLPSGGIHEVPNAFIFRASKTLRFSRMKYLLQSSDKKLKAVPSFLYDYGGNLIFDIKGEQDLPEGQIGIVFIELIGNMRKRSSGIYVLTGGGGVWTKNDELVDEGIAQAISVDADSDDDYMPFSKENMQMLPHLLQHPLQYWVEFMEKNGAFPLRVSFPEHFSSEQVEVEEEC